MTKLIVALLIIFLS